MKKLMLASVVCAASFCGFAATHTITDLANHAGIDKVLKVKVGDTIQLPAPVEGSYQINNTRVATLDGTTLTVVGTGMLGVQQLDGEGVLTGETAAVLSVPDPIGNGRIFRWVSGHWSLSQEGWDTTNGGWEDLATGDRTSYPCQPDDIAILDRYKDWAFEINIRQDISIGGLMVGAYVTDHGDMENYKYRIRGNNDGSINKLTFARTDGKKAFIQICPAARVSGAESGVIKAAFGEGSYPLNIVCASDVELDLGWDGGDSFNTMAYMLFDRGSTLDIPEGKSLTLVNGSPYHKDSLFKTVECLGKLTGAGRFVNSGRAGVLADFDATDFTGTLVEASLGRDGYDRDAQMFLQNSDTYGNANLEVDGFVYRTDYKNYPLTLGAGYFRIGQHHTWPGQEKIGSRLPGQQVTFNGGAVDLFDEQKEWGAEEVCKYLTKTLAVKNGYTLFAVTGNNDETYPSTLFSADTVVHGENGTVTLRSNGLWTENGEYCPRVRTHLPGLRDHLVGGIVPWFAAWSDQPDYGQAGGWESLRFPTLDENDDVINLEVVNQGLEDVAENGNAYVDGNGLNISADKTVNSLVFRNPYGGEKKLGAGRTLTITSGGLIMNSTTRIGENEWNTSVPSENCGTLVFGSRAYVFANNPDAVNNISWIMTPMVAPYGLVSAMAGHLTICGEQTGIDGEIVINAGSLTLGLVRNNNGRDLVLPCLLDVPVRIVGGGAKLILAAGTQLDPTQNVYFEDVGGHAGKLEIPEGSVETCVKCYVDGVTLRRGTWGATGSGADNIDDDHFAGGGVLKVKKDDLVRGLQIIIL